MRKSFMKRTALKILTGLALAVAAQAASADDWTFYIGASAGRTKSAEDACFTPNLPCDRSNQSYGGQIGLEFDPNWAIEGGYRSLGRIVDQNDKAGTYTIVKTKLVELDVLGQLPIGRFVPYLKGGAYLARNQMDSTMITPANANQGGWTYGAGIRFDVTKNIGVRAEWQRYNNVGAAAVGVRTDVETAMLGAVLRF
jgi:opacity protein-like surface antigen